MNWSGWPASEGIFSVCEIPASPWQPIHNSAFALPAAMSAAWANDPQTAAPISIPNKVIRIPTSPVVMAGLVRACPGNPSLLQVIFVLMDARIKSGHDDRDLICPCQKHEAAATRSRAAAPQMIETYFLL